MEDNHNNISNQIIIVLLIMIAVKLGVDFSPLGQVVGGIVGVVLIIWLRSLIPDGFIDKIFSFSEKYPMIGYFGICALLGIVRELLKRIGSLIFG